MSSYYWGTDVYRAFALVLGSDGAPSAEGYPAAENPYEGLEIRGVQDFVPNFPAPRAITGVAQGRVQDTIYLPSLEAQTATMHTLYNVLANNALLQGVKNYQEAGMSIVPYNTEMGGQEPDVALIVSRLVTHNESGLTKWSSFVIPRCRIIPQNAPMNQNATQFTYNIAISKSMTEIWGEDLTVSKQGCTEMGLQDVVTDERLNFVAWKADGSEKTFLLPSDKPAVNPSGANFKVYDYTNAGTPVAGTPGAANFVATGVPTVNHILIAKYEF